MSALVSVIIPVYNLENYIENCLNSIISQTYKNLEILCIDDGSTDKSADKIKSMAEKDERIKYIYQENAGVSAARNKGLDVFTGDYVMFVDGDDYIHPQMVEILYDCINDGYDMVCTFAQTTDKKIVDFPTIKNYECKQVPYSELFESKVSSYLGKAVCGKLFKKDVVISERFPLGINYAEDVFYIISLLNHDINIGLLSCRVYYYYQRCGSCINSPFSFSKTYCIDAFDLLCENFKYGGNKFLKGYCLQYLFMLICSNRTLAIGSECEKQVMDKCRARGKKWIKDFIKNKEIKFIIRISFTAFYYCRPLYEFVRVMQDPTMKDFYKRRRSKKRSS